ncbi:MAG: glycerol-3-phosphate 1-O-acyltransferase PlsY [Clostridiales bacterium]|nr:glycerol-3-phosphate 1-O-acyltransferase PlsY [Candidatus Crickella equi]
MFSTIIKSVFVAIVAYLLGNISPARIISKIYGVDITAEGSGNPGTTNVIRTLGLKAGLLTLLVDALKGYIAVKFGFAFAWPVGEYVAFVFVIIGHCFPYFYKFKGGKGVAAALGAAIALNWPSAMLAIFFGVIVLLIDKRMSVASLSAAILYPILMFFIAREITIFALLVAAFIVYTHIPNIKRIRAGEEPKLEIGKKIKEFKEKNSK